MAMILDGKPNSKKQRRRVKPPSLTIQASQGPSTNNFSALPDGGVGSGMDCCCPPPSIKPYYDRDGIRIYLGDCREILPRLPPVDLVLTDPPYLGLVGGFERIFPGVADRSGPSAAIGDAWGANLEWVTSLPDFVGAVVFCSHMGVPEVAAAFSDKRRVALLTWWDKTSAPTGKNVPRFRSQFAWCFASRPGLEWDGLDDTVFDIPFPTGFAAPHERTGHPTQKPLSLITTILRSLNPQTILDPFMGSGTTLRAAKDLGRRAIGIEIEEKYCEIAVKRLAQEVLPL